MADALIQISLCYSPAPRQLLERALQLPAGSSLAQALAAVPADWQFPADARYGVWNKTLKNEAGAVPHYILQDGDRLEIYRALRVDPMTARRERFKSQGARARSAGLFAQRRPGAKPGY